MINHAINILVIFTVLNIHLSSSQQNNLTTFQSDEFYDLNISLNGRVKSLDQITLESPYYRDTVFYNFDSSGLALSIIKSGSFLNLKSVYSLKNGKIISEKNYANKILKTGKTLDYDEHGRLITIKEFSYRSNDESNPDTPNYIETFQYNTSGLKTVRTMDNISSNVFHKWIYTYDKNGNKIEEGSCDDYKGIKNPSNCNYKPLQGFKYNEKGQLIMDFLIGEWHPENSATYYTYDENGNQIEAKGFYIKNDTTLACIYAYQYNKSGMRIREEEKFGNFRLVRFDHYKITETCYDSLLNITQEKYLTATNTTLKLTRYIYKYDSFGNWIEKVKYEGTNESDLVKLVIDKRVIEYF